jgi:hypothetical protein
LYDSSGLSILKLTVVLRKIIMGAEAPDVERSFPNVEVWMRSLAGRKTVQRVLSDRAAALAKLQS